MPHFSPADLLRQKAMAPANYEHTQSQPSALWTINHNLDLPGTPTVLAYDAGGAWMAYTAVNAVSQNTVTVVFPGPVAGNAIVYIADAYTVGSILVKNELEVGGVEVTGSNGKLLIGGAEVGLAQHSHAFSSLAGIPTTLAGYGITDAASASHAHAFSAITGKPTTLAGYGIGDASPVGHNHTFASLASKPTTLVGYGITDAVVTSVSPSFTGTPTAPTPAAADNSTQIATTAFVQAHKQAVLNVEGGLGWKDLTSELVSRGGSSAPALALFRGNIYAYQFAANSVDQLYSTFHIPHDYAPGTALYIHIHWADASASPTGVVRWGFEYAFAKGHGQEAFPVTRTVYVEQSATGSYKHMVAEISTGILGTAAEVDGLLLVRIFRDATHANDTCPAAVFAFTCDVHYQSDRVATLNRSPNFYA